MRLLEQLCAECPNNKAAKKKTVKLAPLEIEDIEKTDCDVCRCLVNAHIRAMRGLSISQESALVLRVPVLSSKNRTEIRNEY